MAMCIDLEDEDDQPRIVYDIIRRSPYGDEVTDRDYEDQGLAEMRAAQLYLINGSTTVFKAVPRPDIYEPLEHTYCQSCWNPVEVMGDPLCARCESKVLDREFTVRVQVIRVWDVPVKAIDANTALWSVYEMSSAQIEEMGNLINIELDNAELW